MLYYTGCASVLVLALLAGVRGCLLPNRPVGIEDSVAVDRPAAIRPDYTQSVIPPNVAPLNFVVEEPGAEYYVKIRSEQGDPIEVTHPTGRIVISLSPWRKLLEANKGQALYIDVYVKPIDGRWQRFKTITNLIANEDIDGYLAYRLIKPIHNTWTNMGIYQRSLEGYYESLIFHNRSFTHGCVNCHTFWNNRPEPMIMHFRSAAHGTGMLLAKSEGVQKVDLLGAYTSWHPSGRLVAFSVNKVRQFFHFAGPEVRDVCDLDSYVALYLVDSDTVVTTKEIAEKDQMETYPAWSPDGRYLYFCSAPILWTDRDKVPPEHYREVRYDLKRISYEVDTGQWGQAETLLSSKETALSITQPRVSPDGRYLLFCMADYGCFPIYQPSCDLYLMDLQTRQYRRLEINSDQSDSWHGWSTNGRWFVFSSKRGNGLFARPYFSYFDTQGKVHKPFVLPQKDPTLYDRQFMTYNVPELVTGPIHLGTEDFGAAVRATDKIKVQMPVTGATPRIETQPTTAWIEYGTQDPLTREK